MKSIFLSISALMVSGVANAAVAASAQNSSEPSPYLLVLAGVALIGTIAHRRSKLKARA